MHTLVRFLKVWALCKNINDDEIANETENRQVTLGHGMQAVDAQGLSFDRSHLEAADKAMHPKKDEPEPDFEGSDLLTQAFSHRCNQETPIT